MEWFRRPHCYTSLAEVSDLRASARELNFKLQCLKLEVGELCADWCVARACLQ